MSPDSGIVFGRHAVRHALERHPEDAQAVWLQRGVKPAGVLAGIIELARRHKVTVSWRPREALDRKAGGAVHQGVLLLRRGEAATGPVGVEDILAGLGGRPALLLILEGVQDPHNLGACLRTADAAGADAVIIPRDRAVGITATVRKVASGAAEHTPVIAVPNLARILRNLKEAGIWIVGTAEEAERSLYDIDLTVPLALVMGAEGRGLRQNTRRHCDFLAALPMRGTVESLNVAVAAGVCLYEAVRQRGG
ncbi:MAG: 23S rRNA (guanosine(2251)-2'-O)-methyltransferase RlmB [Gammaproteobacteria bacterium]|jgi:23S rRNA (guanosine2251-2'-O)-methyltransferase